MRIASFLPFIFSVLVLVSSCGNISESNYETPILSDIPANDQSFSPIRFGEAQDILLLEIEWFTADEFWEAIKEEIEKLLAEHENPDEISLILEQNLETIRNQEVFIAKSINGICTIESDIHFESFNPHNNAQPWDNRFNIIDPDGYYILNIFPYRHNIFYTDEGGEFQLKSFPADGYVDSEMEFSLIVDDIVAYCDELLATGKITQEEYKRFAITSPLDFYVRVKGFFDAGNMKYHPPFDKSILPPPPVIITDKDEISVLWLVNVDFYGNLAEQFKSIAESYDIMVNYSTLNRSIDYISFSDLQTALIMIKDNNFDYVIIQDANSRLVWDKAGYFDVVERLSEAARESGSILLLFNNELSVDADRNPDKELQLFYTAPIERAAKMYGAIPINVADAWFYARDKHPDISFNIRGDEMNIGVTDTSTFFAACVFISTLFDIQVNNNIVGNDYDDEEIIKLGKLIWEYVQYYHSK